VAGTAARTVLRRNNPGKKKLPPDAKPEGRIKKLTMLITIELV